VSILKPLVFNALKADYIYHLSLLSAYALSGLLNNTITLKIFVILKALNQLEPSQVPHPLQYDRL
jgi:hypothetical protein